jgi:hypothetical protein
MAAAEPSKMAREAFAAISHQRLDALGDLRCGVLVELQEIFEVPADAFALLRAELERDLQSQALRLEIGYALGSYLDPIAVCGAARVLVNSQYWHVRSHSQNGGMKLSRLRSHAISTTMSRFKKGPVIARREKPPGEPLARTVDLQVQP